MGEKKNWKKMARRVYRLGLRWIITRGTEPTTWLGMSVLAGAFGYNSPEWSALSYKFAGLSAALAMILGEKASKPNPGNKISID